VPHLSPYSENFTSFYWYYSMEENRYGGERVSPKGESLEDFTPGVKIAQEEAGEDRPQRYIAARPAAAQTDSPFAVPGEPPPNGIPPLHCA
jgi:hypothetical protein